MKYPRYVISGIDTGIGKTICSALLCAGLNAFYWKPVQSGLEEETDSEAVQRLAGMPASHILPETYRLQWPASPHASAAREGVVIDPAKLTIPDADGPLIIEGAGGLMVPLNEEVDFLDLFTGWKIPVVLVVKTYLGSINHSLLSIEALKARGIPIKGIIFNDAGRPESESVILSRSGVPQLGRIPEMTDITPEKLREVFATHFNPADWQ